LLKALTDSDHSIFSDESDSSGTECLTVGEVIAEFSDHECADVQFATPSSAPSVSSASSAIFTWEDMANYVGQREQFVNNYGPQNVFQTETHCAKVFKMLFNEELVELIVRQRNTYSAQKMQHKKCSTKNTNQKFFPLRSRMRDWKHFTTDEMYVVLAFFMLMGIIQNPILRSYFSKKIILATPNFGSIISMDRFESICNFMHLINNDNIGT
jgi:hypothetical protein